MCGIGAAFGWAVGFVVAKHGISVGFSPADLAFHRFFWTGLLLMPVALRDDIRDLGGFGWGRGLSCRCWPDRRRRCSPIPDFMLVPLGHGTTIQPACAALFGIILASRGAGRAADDRAHRRRRGDHRRAVVFGIELLTTIGGHGVGGDLLFVTAGLFWATFGMLLRKWHLPGLRAVTVVGALSLLIYAPLHGVFIGYAGLLRMSWQENLLQALVQGLLAGMLPIYLFARAVILLGAGRAATFPALVPGFGLSSVIWRWASCRASRRSSACSSS